MPIHRPALSTVFFVLVVAGPFASVMIFMLSYSLGGIGLLSQGWTTTYWLAALSDSQTWVSFLYTAYVGSVSLVGAMLLALMIVFSLGARLRQGWLGTLIYVPLTIPPVVAALLTAEMFGETGLLSRIAYALGWIVQPADFPALVYSRWGVGIILAHLGLVTPFLVLLFDRLRRNERVDALMQLSQTLGASRWQALRQIAIPVILYAALPALSVYFVVLNGAFEIPLMIGAQSPTMISVSIWRHFSQFDLATKPEAYVLTIFYTGVMFAGLLITRRLRKSSDPGAP